ncbi:virulence factor TspB C-terminal domain-related protein [Acidovorax sp.]|uniref:virulence factor TspB C-terminal domain-related protein n=1 Tax=Acidovorax sp. TaxID=1872122 RepID=UPI001AC577F4|nr:virulence factor TspB C-terminal domain-related protein [Acidovorax sp.]MBN9626045.1 hypothetical protein [Acidovorax sp.]
MAHRFKLVIAAALGVFAASANAGYAQLAPPPGWTPGQYVPAANDASYGRIIFSPNGPTTTVGGQSVRMPAAYRLAANAPRIAAAAIYAHPYVRTGVAIAGWLIAAKLVWDEASKSWKSIAPDANSYVSDGSRYLAWPGASTYHYSLDAACTARAAYMSNASVTYSLSSTSNGYQCNLTYRMSDGRTGNYTVGVEKFASSTCPAGWYVTPAGCVQTPPPKQVSQQEFEDALAPKPMPEKVPQELPQPTPLPIEQPSPWINPEPGSNPSHRPRFVPTGDPVPNPNYDPNAPPSEQNQPWVQPGIRIVPSPTIAEPWRVDVQPVSRPKPTPDPATDPENEPGDKPSDQEEQPDLCEKYPDIVACKTLGGPVEAKPVPNENKDMTITPDSGWGQGPGACPAPKSVTVHGFTLQMPFDLLCQFANGIRPVVIGLAWLAAAFTFMGIGRRA